MLSEQITRDYRIIRQLGRGGMGEVFLAEQLRVGRRRVALKVLHRSCSADPELVRRFENEASSAGRINHRNVVTVYESRATDDGQMYVAMEYIEGKSLGQLLDEGEVLPLRQTVEITRQIGAALTAAHKLGIVHRDIKPDNIMLTEEDGVLTVKVLDFGIARLAETDARGKTRSGEIMGTPGYMSPEQAMGKTGNQIDARSDVYSLGMVVYQMLAGRTAFDGKSPLELIRQHLSEPPLPPGHYRPEMRIPQEVEAVVLKALRKRREKRHQSVAEFVNELEAAAAPKVSSASQKDIPTVRVGFEPATAPLSSEQQTTPRAPRITKENRQYQNREANRHPATVVSEPPRHLRAGDERRMEQAASGPGSKLWMSAARKSLLVGGLVLVLLIASVYTILQMTPTSDISHRVMEFRIKREMPTADLDTLDVNNSIKAGDGFGFEVKLIDPGLIYLFEQSDGGHGRWQWLNPSTNTTAQQIAVGEWHKFPNAYYLKAGYQTGTKRYLFVLVPSGMFWSPAEALREGLYAKQLTVKNDVVELPAELASSIRETLIKDTVMLQADGRKEGRNVAFGLVTKSASQRIAIYELTVQQTP